MRAGMDKLIFLEQSPYFVSWHEDEHMRFYLFEEHEGRGWINVPLTAYNEIYWEYVDFKKITIHRTNWTVGGSIPDWFVDLVSITLAKVEKRDRIRRLFI